MNNQLDIDKIYAKDPYEEKYQFLINKRESILKLLLNTQMIYKMFIKILKNTILVKNVKY